MGSLQNVQFNIKNRGGGCVRDDTGKPMSWCVIRTDGSIG